ncbi:MAG: hypothetical protein ACXVZX_02270 [Terriglobales bacterium]
MKRACLFAITLCVLLAQVPARASEVIDRIIAIVNNTPVLLSEWDEAWRCEALLAGRTPESYSGTEQQDIFNRLVDQELLRQQMRGYMLPAVSDNDLAAREKEVRAQLEGSDDARWRTILRGAGVSEEELRYHMRRQMELERFIDIRFRAGIRVEDRAVTRYYRDEFLPELRKAGGKEVPLDDVAGKIREILVQQRIAEQLSSWIQALREQAEIRTPQEVRADSNSIDLTLSK